MGMTIDYEHVPQGWQCPICKRVYSPTTTMCMYCGEAGASKTYTTTTITHNNEVDEQYEDTDLIKVEYVRQAIQEKNQLAKGGCQ